VKTSELVIHPQKQDIEDSMALYMYNFIFSMFLSHWTREAKLIRLGLNETLWNWNSLNYDWIETIGWEDKLIRLGLSSSVLSALFHLIILELIFELYSTIGTIGND
jgi:hypothetical protein